MRLDLAAQGDELRPVPAQKAALLLLRRGFADDAAGPGVAMDGAVAHQPGEGRGITGVGLAPPGEGLGGEGQDLRAGLPELPLEAPAKAARFHPDHAAPAPRPQGREQAQDGLASHRAQAHGLGQPALYGDAGTRLLEVRPEAEHARHARKLRGSLRALQALAQRRKVFQDVFGLGVELVFFHQNALCARATLSAALSAQMTLALSFIPLTAPRVTLAAAHHPAAFAHPAPAMSPQPARRAPQSLSLGSLGVFHVRSVMRVLSSPIFRSEAVFPARDSSLPLPSS